MVMEGDTKHVLVTGSTGAIGQPVCHHLAVRGHQVRGFARRPTPGLSDFITGDLNDRDAVFRAVKGTDTIVHLGAYPNDADFMEVLLQPNVVGLHYICEAAQEHGVKRLILSSSVQAVGGHGFPDRVISVEDGPAPVNYYALTKVWAESAGEMMARCHDMSVISVRIGWLPRNRTEARSVAAHRIGPDVFFSHNDAKRFYERCVESDTPSAGTAVTLFATSIPASLERLDLGPSRRIIGYDPQNRWPEGLPYPVDNLDEE